MKKKMLSLVLAGAMTAVLMTGCGSEGGSAESGSTADGAATETETTEAGETEAADAQDGESADDAQAAGGEGGTFKIGGIGPLTGSAAVYGIATMNGSQIAVDEINAAGGINGMTVELNFQDDECDVRSQLTLTTH